MPLTRATSILDAIVANRSSLTLAQISSQTGIARSTVHRIILDLQAQRYVVSASSAGGYRLGPRLVGIAVTSYVQHVAPLRPMLVGLSRTVNENVDLAMLERDDVMIIEQVAAVPGVPTSVRLGKPFATHASCLGKALLAQLPTDQARTLLDRPLRRFTNHTIVDPDALMAELDVVRRSGIAFDEEERDLGISAVAIAIRNRAGFDQAVSIVAPTVRFRERRTAYVRALIQWRQMAATKGIVQPLVAASC